MQLLQLSGFLVLAQRLAMEVPGLPVQLAQARVGGLGHQVLAAFGGRALATGLLVRAVAELLRPPSPLTMLLGTWSVHDRTVLRRPAVRGQHDRLAVYAEEATADVAASARAPRSAVVAGGSGGSPYVAA
jgi:hypothetical protein